MGDPMSSRLKFFALIGALTFAAPALAQTAKPAAAPPAPAGSAVAVTPAAFATLSKKERTLVAGQDVFGGDVIKTSEAGQAQIVFKDNTRLAVGPDSSVTIDKFVLADDGGAALKFTKGAFRFITGTGAHSSYSLETPTATIGIRGTKFDVAVGSGGTAVLVFKGAVEVCAKSGGQCATLRRNCAAAIVTNDGALNVPKRNEPRAGLIDAAFPLAKEQKTLRKDFRVFTGGCGSGDGGTGKSKGGSNGGKGGGGGGRGGGNGK
jgi:hypothetical protein